MKGKCDYGKRFIRTEFSQINGGEKKRRRSYYKIKNTLDYPNLCLAADFAEARISLENVELLFGNALPKSYENLGVCDNPIATNQLVAEINWTLIAIRKYHYEINLFLLYKQDYESYLIRGEYEMAERLISKIESEICFSLWTIENRFLLKELQNKSKENKIFLTHFNETNLSTGYTKSLVHYLSNRAEKALSVSRYNSDLRSALGKLKGSNKEEHIDYYMFKLSFLNHLDFTNYTEIIVYDFQHSIIDRYLNFRKLLSLLLCKSNKGDDHYKRNNKKYFNDRVKYILKKVNDPMLVSLNLLTGGDELPLVYREEDKKQLDCIDKYTLGLYQEVEIELAEYLIANPTQFDLYILYTKCIVYQKKGFIPVGDIKNIQNQILLDLYKIISASGNPNNSSLNLLRIANNIASSTISYGIVDFVTSYVKGKSERNLLGKLSYNINNPNIYLSLESELDQVSYLNTLRKKFPNSVTIDFFQSKLSKNGDISKFEKIIPEARYKTEVAHSFQKLGNYKAALDIWLYIIDTHYDIIPIVETAVKNLFICYEKLEQFNDCIILYVDNYLKNPYLISNINVKSIVYKIKTNRFRVVLPSIELPIFYTITNADENELHTTFEMFNIANKVLKPSEFLNNSNIDINPKTIFFLRYTCKQEILRHSTNINGSRERLEERLSILQFLKSVDTTEKDNYDAEIKSISNILIIQKGLIDLDDGKIYVNEQGILANELTDYEAIFNRFQTIAGLVNNKKSKSLLFMIKGKLTQMNYTDEYVESEKIEYSNNPVFELYLEMFEAIKEKFLYSKDGIVTYLSTRIRHGVLLGEIRPVFEKFKLITQKDGNTSVYRNNVHWDNIYIINPKHTKEALQLLLQNFSYKVDGIIFDLIKKYLQVFDSENNKYGWFDYTFSEEDLFWFSLTSLNSTNFAHFVEQVFQVLWDRTDKNLTIIRNNIQTDILGQFNNTFNELELNVTRLLNSYDSQYIIAEIKKCSTETQTVITRIASWFKRSGTSASDFLLENVIDIVIGYADKNSRISLNKSIDCSHSIKGIYLKHFADLLWIFTENILKHSDETIDKIHTNISTTTIDSILFITIDNIITNSERLDSSKNIWQDSRIDVRKLSSEGKSGYHKALKILKYDLMDTNNFLQAKINDTKDVFSVEMSINLNKLTS